MQQGVTSAGLFVAFAVTAGCGGGLTNAQWVAEPEGGAVAAATPAGLEVDEAPGDSPVAAAPGAGPHRLDHTVTLGEVVEVPRDRGAAPTAAAAPPTIVINVNNYGAPGGYGYGYGYAAPVAAGRGSAFTSAPFSANRGAATLQPGQSWPAPASHGPAFPFNLSPASPWETKR